jgi:GT2 family glycosyltransferase
MTAPTMLARRSVFDEVGLYDPEFFYGENADWLARAKERGMQYGLLEEPLYLRRVHARNVSHALDVERSAVILAVKRSLDRRRKGQAG